MHASEPSIHDLLKRSLRAADDLYYRLVLLVGETGSGKTAVLHRLAADLGTEPVNVNRDLALELLELTPGQRALHLPALFGRIMNDVRSPVLLDNLEILFDPALHQDPLRLLQGIARQRTVVASWNGTLAAGKLSYAEIGHPEYRRYDEIDALIVGMDGRASIDPNRDTNPKGTA